MLDKILGVSPSPQNEAPRESNKPDPKAKNDFEKLLSSSNQQKEAKTKSFESKKGKSEEREPVKKENEKEELVTKSSRGTKKKMTEVETDLQEIDPMTVTMISNVMASPESEFEIPDLEANLAQIEEQPETSAQLNVQTKSAALAQAESALAWLAQQSMATEETSSEDSAIEQSLDLNKTTAELMAPMAEDYVEPQSSKDASMPLDSEEENLINTSGINQDIDQDLSEVSEKLRSAVASDQVMVKDEIEPTFDAVDQKIAQSLKDSGMIPLIKDFEESHGLTGEKANEFELKILNQLKSEYQQLQQSIASSKTSAATGDQLQQSTQDQSGQLYNQSRESQTSDLSSEFKPESLKADSLLHVGQSHHIDFKSQMMNKAEAGIDPSKLTQLEAAQDKNIQEVMKQAQYLVKRGGGEMTVKMSPDGIGEVQLKVMLDGGKVNIEMQTQDRSIKKMIEDSLSELKSGLAAHRLNVEHVKIDTVNATNTDQRSFLETNLGQSGGQYEQRDFWKQFQENFGNQARRSSYGEISSHGQAKNRMEPEALRPIHYSQNGYRSNGRTGSTLNQVA